VDEYELFVNGTAKAKTSSPTYTVGDLQADTSYAFTVRAHNEGGWGETSPAVTATTKAAVVPGAPGMPQNLEAVAPATGGINLSWNPVTGAQKYHIRYGLSADSITIEGNETSESSLWVGGLSNNTTYYFQVRAGNSAGWSAWSGAKSAKTADVASTTPTVTGVIVSPASVSVAKGGAQPFTAVVTGTNNPAQTVTWTVSGASSTATKFDGATLTVAANETAAALTVRATSTVDTAKNGTAAVTVTITGGGGTGYAVGAVGPAGGYIFYDKGSYSDGWRYLEAAPIGREFTAQWGAYGYDVQGTSTAIGTGKQNTEIILIFLRSTDEFGRAVQRCDSLSFDGFDDWFLPSLGELYLMWENLKQKGLGGFTNNSYWSSSQSDSGSSWYLPFSNGTQATTYKSSSILIRAVRAF
jgi:uncharacterized protein YjdB